MSEASGYMGAKYFQELGPRLFDMSSAGGHMGAKYAQECGPRLFDLTHKWIWVWIYPLCEPLEYPVNRGGLPGLHKRLPAA